MRRMLAIVMACVAMAALATGNAIQIVPTHAGGAEILTAWGGDCYIQTTGRGCR